MFQEHLLDSAHVCNNCFRRRRRPAVRHRSHQPDETYSERIRWETIVEDVPGALASESKTVFCDCGVDGAFARIWDDREVDLERFATLLTNALETGRQLDLISSRQQLHQAGEAAWQWFDAGASVNRCLTEAFDAVADTTEPVSQAIAD